MGETADIGVTGGVTWRPTFSVVIPAYARQAALQRCLTAVAALDWPAADHEVVVVDDGSPGGPPQVAWQSGARLRVVRQANGGPGTARNRGAREAVGRYLAFLDDDCAPERDWLRALAARFAQQPNVLLGGGIVNDLPDNHFATATHLIVEYGHLHQQLRGTGAQVFTTSNLAVPRDAFLELGGFDSGFALPAGEDYDFCQRWHDAGLNAAYVPEARVRHAHVMGLRGFCAQHLRYGRGLYTWRRGLAQQHGGRALGSSPAFYVGLLAYPLRQSRGWSKLPQLSCVILSQILTGLGAMLEARAASRRRRVGTA